MTGKRGIRRASTAGRRNVFPCSSSEGEQGNATELDRLEELEWVALDEVSAWRVDQVLRVSSVPSE